MMTHKFNLKEMAEQIAAIKASVMELKKLSDGIPAVEKNSDRILASIKMLEINISDMVDEA
jgi:hypothetical protein